MHRELIRGEQPSREAAQRHLLDLQDTLEAIRTNDVLEMGAVAWPLGLDRAILNELPLETGTRFRLVHARLVQGDTTLSVYELLRLTNFGRKSLAELLFAVEEFLNECIRNGINDSPQEAVTDDPIAIPAQEVTVSRGAGSNRDRDTATPRVEAPSGEAAQLYLFDLQDALEAIRRNQRPNLHSVAWPTGLDRSLLNGLPLEVRTRNCLLSAGLMEGDSPLTVQQVLRLANFGRKSLRDLLFTVESFLNECIRIGSRDSQDTAEASRGTPDDPNALDTATTRAQAPRMPWGDASQVLNSLLAAASELHGVETLADVLSPQVMELANRMGIARAVDAIRIGHVTEGTPGLVSVTLSRVALATDTASEAERTIIEHRMLRTPRTTLAEVGAQVGVTRERIRQVQARIERKVRAALGREVRTVASVLKERLGHVAEEGTVERQIEEILPADQGLATRLFRRALLDEMGFTLDSGVFLDKRATKELRDIRAGTRKLADDVGLVDEQELIESLPSEEWRRFWPWVRERCELFDLFGSLGIRDSGKARAKAALISIGCLATPEEVARMCGFSVNKTRSHLSVIPSVVKADKDRWGLKEWVDDEYDGITGEIIQRIEEDGGATTIERLLTELPRKFGVNPMSVRAYMQTAKFTIRDGWISLASKSSIRLRDLDDVIDGRDDTGAPYWTFPVEARYFDGYSVPSVPPEFAKAIGCAPDGSEQVRLENLPDCRDLSINWRLASITGASLGYVGEPLKRLGLELGERARITIKGSCLVKLTADDGVCQPPRDTEADGILQRIMQRRKVL
ncbi:MAG: hypothetical protein OXU81_19450 [Gammaproteobacteria bacterium]|nr:hypothetical protein [Gammaproteobacteria bacterium]